MITIKNKQAFDLMRTAGRLLAELFEELKSVVVSGKNALEIEQYVDLYLKKHRLVSQSKGYAGYKHVSCISVNDEVVHGIPTQNKIFQPNDLVKIDICAAWNGYCADMARCFLLEAVSAEGRKVVEVAQRSLDMGINQAIPGVRLGTVSFAIQQEIEKHGFGVVRDFAGHGIGKKMHEEPEILNYGYPEKGPLLREGMALALEPMVTVGHYEVYVDVDGWTAKTLDKSLAAHVEDTILITEHGNEVITRL